MTLIELKLMLQKLNIAVFRPLSSHFAQLFL